MSKETKKLRDLMVDRARTYGMLARLFRVEVDRDTLKELQGMRFPTATGSSAVDEGYRMMFNYLRTAWDDSVTELAIDYVRTFIGHGVNGYSAAYPFESVYTSERRLLMQEARAEVLETLRENNLKRGSWNEGEDHIALELEFMQRTSLRCADALDAGNEDEAIKQLNVQHMFMKDHLLNWIPLFVADVHKFSKTGFYRGLGTLLWGYVEFDEGIVSELLDSVKDNVA